MKTSLAETFTNTQEWLGMLILPFSGSGEKGAKVKKDKKKKKVRKDKEKKRRG